MSWRISKTGRSKLCHYYFEQRTSGELSEAAEEKITDLVRENIIGRTDFAVQWFGGEPLLSLSLMERLSAAFLRLSAKHAVRYAATVICENHNESDASRPQ